MTKKAQQWYSLNQEQLGKLVGQGTYPGASAAWERARKIEDVGHTATIFYSEFNGFRVLDEDDDRQFQQSISIGNRSRRFPI